MVSLHPDQACACLKAAAGLGGSFSRPSSCESPSCSPGPRTVLGSPHPESSLELPVPVTGTLPPRTVLLSHQPRVDDGGDDGSQVRGLPRLRGPSSDVVEGVLILP